MMSREDSRNDMTHENISSYTHTKHRHTLNRHTDEFTK